MDVDDDDFGFIVVSQSGMRNIVEQAPERALVSLETLTALDRRPPLVSKGRLYVGWDRTGTSVVYRVVGWNAALCALEVQRDTPLGRDAGVFA